jgi:hypothetical protein
MCPFCISALAVVAAKAALATGGGAIFTRALLKHMRDESDPSDDSDQPSQQSETPGAGSVRS